MFIHAVEFDVANAIIPLGYTAADLGYLIDGPTNLNLAAIGLITYTCQDDDLGIGEHTQAAIAIFIDPPVIDGIQSERDEVFIDVYEPHRYFSNAEQAARYAAAGWSTTVGIDGSVSAFVEPAADLDDHRIPQPAAGTSSAELNGTSLWSGGVGGATGFRLKNETLRFWQETPNGVSYIEFENDKHGRGSISQCSYDPQSLIAITLGRSTCQAGENLGVAVNDFDVNGLIMHLPGVSA